MYRVTLHNFEGPLDLLLFFIQRDELDIYDIPISYITEQFLEYIRFLEELDLNIASDFIYMASTLMSIKAKMMLPVPDDKEEEWSEEDPRFELVQALLEYKRYKEAGREMLELEKSARGSYTRSLTEYDKIAPVHKGEALREITMIDLMAAFKKVMASISDNNYHQIRKLETDIETQSNFIEAHLRKHGKSSFLDICRSLTSRIAVIITFLALLELVKEQQIKLYLSSRKTHFYVDLYTSDEL